MMVLTIFSVIAFFAGMGFAVPLIGLCILKCKLFPPRKKEMFISEFQFMSDWLVCQCIVGGLVIAAIPIAYMSFNALAVTYYCFIYFLISIFSGVLGLVYVENHARHTRP